VLLESFLRRLQGKTYAAKLRIYLYCWWHKSQLVRTLQAVENMASVSLKASVPGELSMSEKWRLSKELMRPDHLNFVSNDAAVKMYKMFLIMYIVECGKHIKLEFKDVPQQTAETALDSIGHDYMWAVRRITRPPPMEVTDNEAWYLCRKALYIESERHLPGNDECPIHPGWVESSVPRIDAIADDFFNFESSSKDSFVKEFGQGEIHKIWNERLVMSSYQDFCSSVLGVLRDQLDVAGTLQTKFLGALATLVIALTNFLFKMYIAEALAKVLPDIAES